MSQAFSPGFRPSQLHEQRFSVEFEYPVVFCRGALNPAERALAWCIARREPERRQPVFAVLGILGLLLMILFRPRKPLIGYSRD